MNATVVESTTLLHRAGNLLKTGVLLAALSALVLLLGQRFGGTSGLLTAGAFVLLMNFGSYWFSDRIALAMNGARALPPNELPWLHALVSQLSAHAELPPPRLYVIASDTPNAFATGRSPAKAAIAVTTGLLEALDRRELTGVLAHELAHVKNRDTLIMTVAATLAGVISHLAQLAFFWGGALLGGRSDDREDSGGSALGTLGLLLVAPLTATLLQLAISRSREFDADATAAQLTGDPLALANALARLEQGNKLRPMDHSPATAHLFIVNPLSGGGLMGLFSTHPPIGERIERLVQLR
ncbi:MAG: zinc metalloprotease HtpX [Myxococcaceae bacterium]|nr:zinc metalloprotease HtpX [Myxococcaceae bacterium]